MSVAFFSSSPRRFRPGLKLVTALVGSPGNVMVTALCLILLWVSLPPLFDWAIVDAKWRGGAAACAGNEGACWPFIAARFDQFLFGPYPLQQQWRPASFLVTAALGVGWLMLRRSPGKRPVGLIMLTVFPVAGAVLLAGGLFGLMPVSTSQWGGVTLTVVTAAWTIVTSLLFGLALALGRRSEMPIVRVAATVYIEIWRGLPLIGVLFMAATMFPLFVPEGVEVDKLMRALIALTLFNSAYMAEVFRGGLQAIGRGQYDAADALGLRRWNALRLVILPQAVRIALPGIVNTCISIAKQSTVLLTIGLFELLGTVQAGTSDPEWLAAGQVVQTGYVFVGLVFWAFCFGMSRYSRSMESRQAEAS